MFASPSNDFEFQKPVNKRQAKLSAKQMSGTKRRKPDNLFQSDTSDVIINCEEVASNYMSSSNDYSGIIYDQDKNYEYDEEVTQDNIPFKSRKEMLDAQKKIAKIKNNQAARKYRMKKRQNDECLEKQLNDVESQRNQLQLDNAGLRAENQLLKSQLQYFQNIFAKKSSTASTTDKSPAALHATKVDTLDISSNISDSQSEITDMEQGSQKKKKKSRRPKCDISSSSECGKKTKSNSSRKSCKNCKCE